MEKILLITALLFSFQSFGTSPIYYEEGSPNPPPNPPPEPVYEIIEPKQTVAWFNNCDCKCPVLKQVSIGKDLKKNPKPIKWKQTFKIDDSNMGGAFNPVKKDPVTTGRR